MRVLGIIPARGGSKGIKNKNIRLIDGVPLLSYAIKTASESMTLTDFIVASDSPEILNIAKKYGCNYYKRETANAQDSSPIEPVIFEVLNYLNDKYDLIILLQPTAPIRTGVDIDNVVKMFREDSDLKNVISVVQLEDIHPARMYNIDDNMNMNPLNSNGEKLRRQKLPSVFLRNGCIYAITTSAFTQYKSLILDEKKAYIMQHSKWLNIDQERDLIMADYMVKQWKLENSQ